MKTLTVTYHHTTNYGATFQMFALHKTIVKAGHENLVLETNLPSWKSGEKKGLYAFFRSVYFDICKHLRKNEMQNLISSFRQFKSDNVSFTRAYTSMQDLKNDVPQVDCLITGSDQVWNLRTQPSMIPSRLLQFGTPELVRFSYAASIEHTNYTEEQKEMVKDALKSYKGISLREESAREYIETITGKECLRVLDPVFLMARNEWRTYAVEPRIKGPYILCYQVQSNRSMARVAKHLKARTGYPIVTINNVPFPWFKADKTLYDVSPQEFLGLYDHASYIVGASFHGVALGIVFGKPVYALIKKINGNRIKEVMNMFGLSDYVVNEDDSAELKEYTADVLETVEEIKNHEREKSMGYLLRMLGNEN